MNFSVDYNFSSASAQHHLAHGRNSPLSMRMMDTNKMLRSLVLSNPVSPERQIKIEEMFIKRNSIWNATSNYIRDKLKNKKSLIEQQDQHKVTREDFYTPNERNNGKPHFVHKKGQSRDLPDSVRHFYQNLRFGK